MKKRILRAGTNGAEANLFCLDFVIYSKYPIFA